MRNMPLGAIILTTSLALGGCADRGLRDLRTSSPGPEEFMVLPVKPLTIPDNTAALPPPAPGRANLVDINPPGDAVASLGGNAGALDPSGGVPASDGALVAQAGRYGVPANTRAALAADDAQFRARQSRMTGFRLFPVDRYEQAYRKQALEPFAVNQQFRRRGFGTPSAPPETE